MASSAQVVRVGVGVLVKDPADPNKVFAGLRKNSHGEGTLALPGGHLEMYESWGDCAIREVLEETGLDIHNVKFGHVTNDIMKDQQKHYITIFMMAECVPPPSFLGMAMHPKPRNLEPHKCHGWDSYSWDELCILAGNDVSDKDGATAVELFGPLLQLVKESPQTVIDFINKS
ncbi:hypothetical protein ACHAW6_010706 [Cyclotella cf. meneghiniana]